MTFDELCAEIREAKEKMLAVGANPKTILIRPDMANLLYQNGIGGEIYGMMILQVNSENANFIFAEVPDE